jgi:hypothetical protein
MKILRHVCFALFLISFFLGCSQDRIVPIMSYADSVKKAQEVYKNEPFVEADQTLEPANAIQELIDSGKVSVEETEAISISDINDFENLENIGEAKLFFDGSFDDLIIGGEPGSGGGGEGGPADPDAYLKSLLPLDITFIKLYKIRDMLSLKKHTMSDQIRLQSEGMVYLSVKKNGQEVDIAKLKPRIEISSNRYLPKASLYYEVKHPKYGQSWNFAEELSASKIKTRGDTTFYVYSPTSYGWTQVAAPYDTLVGKTSMKFASTKPKTSTLSMFLAYPKTKSIMRADTAGFTPNVPVGEKFEAVVIAQTAKKEYFGFFQSKIANKDLVIDVILKKMTQKQLVSKLDSLK